MEGLSPALDWRIPDDLWAEIEWLLPEHKNTHRFGGGRPRTPLLRLEEALTRLPGIEADEQLTQAVMSRIACLSSSPVRNGVHRDLLAVSLMVAGTLILAIVYWWTAAWSDELASFFHISIIGRWAAMAAQLGALRIEILLLTLVGAALLTMGLTRESAQPADAPN